MVRCAQVFRDNCYSQKKKLKQIKSITIIPNPYKRAIEIQNICAINNVYSFK